jgi:cation diffusion facilitator family transporter
MEAGQKNIRIQQVVVVLAVVLFAIKLAAYYLTNSVAILTDALESIVNVVAGFFGLYSLYLSAKPRDEDHPYGHGKIEFISAAVEGTLILIAGLLIISESVSNLFNPHTINSLDWGIVLIGSTAIINYITGAVCISIGTKNNSIALIAGGKHLQSDTYSTIGIIAGLILIYFTHLPWLDSAVAILFGLIIILTGYKIIRKSVAGIMDESDYTLLERMVKLLNENRRENWVDLHNTRIIKFGSILHLDAHLTVPWYLNVHEAHVEIDALAERVRKEFGETLELFVHSDGCLDFSCKICQKKDCPVRKFPFERKIEWTVENIVNDQKHQVNS